MVLLDLWIFLNGSLRADEVTPTRLRVKERSEGVDNRRWVARTVERVDRCELPNCAFKDDSCFVIEVERRERIRGKEKGCRNKYSGFEGLVCATGKRWGQ